MITAATMGAPLIIEVRANEGMKRHDAAEVPYAPAEIIADAIECAYAGASVYHWHARDPVSGATIDDAAAFLATSEGIRRGSDMILKPTTGFNRESAAARLAHIAALVQANPAYVDVIPVDNFTANADIWDAQAKRFLTDDFIYANTRRNVLDSIGLAAELGVPITLACPDIGAIRTGICYREMGVLGAAIHWELVFSGTSLPLASTPTLPALQAMVAALPQGDTWSVFCTGGDILPLAGAVIAMGGHVAVGLGDHAHQKFGRIRNRDLVHRVRQAAELCARPVASIAEAREILHLHKHEHQGSRQ